MSTDRLCKPACQSDMQVKRCSTFFRRIRSSEPGEDCGLHLAETEKELGLKNADGSLRNERAD